MAQRKLSAPRIFDGTRFHENSALIVAEDGTIEALVPAPEAGDAERFEGILTPGFINAHCHLELSHMKGQIPEHTGLVDFVLLVISGRSEREATMPEAIAAAAEEMRRNGIVAVGDISNTTDTVSQKKLGHMRYYNFVEVLGWAPAGADASYRRSVEVLKGFEGCGPAALVPHASYTVSDPLWQLLQPHFGGHTISVHNQETPDEDEFIRNGSGAFVELYQKLGVDNRHHAGKGMSSLRSYFNKLHNAERRLLVHNTFLPEEDLAYALQTAGDSTFFCLCINANLYIENKVPSVEILRRHGAAIVIGTDSLASNWQLGVHEEIRSLRKHFPQVPLEEILGWATLNGAKALQMEDTLGSFEKGKTPGVVLLDPETLEVRRLA
ncbi:MAG: amidohydrolase [Chitinophagaceae bacterium]|nr:MAG: amidohydrolase [Chitinophagaceae bacterium]